MRVLPDVQVPLRDGCRLGADLYLPQEPGPHPTILERTPYGKDRTDQSEIAPGLAQPRSRRELAEAFTSRGYALVVQDCRGTGTSEGRFEKYVNEARDGQDSIAWVAAQSWSDGRVGTMGFSYGSAAQLATATLGSPHLVAMFLDSGGFFDAHGSGIRQGGCFDLKQATWAYQQALRMARARDDAELERAVLAQSLSEWLRRTPWRAGHSPVAAFPDLEREVTDAWNTEVFGPYWKRPGLYAREAVPTLATVPIFLLSAWFDTSLRNTAELWRALAQHGCHAPLVIGPWCHGERHTTWAGELDFGPHAALSAIGLGADTLTLRLDWFDSVLGRDAQAVRTAAAPVRYYLMGGGTGARDSNGRTDHGGAWMSASCWPPTQAGTVTLHLAPDYRLQATAPEPGVHRVVCDPAAPVPTIGGAINSGQPVMAGGAFDQVARADHLGADGCTGPLARRDDVLVYETETLTDDVSVVGAVRARLFVQTDGPDADVAIKLIDVYPPHDADAAGPAYNICDGILRLSHRHGAAGVQPMRAGETCEVLVEAYPTANRFLAGHRIRLAIAGSNFPHFDINPNTDPARRSMAHARRAQLAVCMGPATPSSLMLDVLP
ncbi:MAG: CocE/NonD family hydrolase [Rhodoferax sp.]|nr:CocE/NonD family hydrolase [Rhodoferax sp.]